MKNTFKTIILLAFLIGFTQTALAQWSQTKGGLTVVSAIDYNTAWGISPGDGVYRSNDGGQTWQQPNEERISSRLQHCLGCFFR